MLTRLYLTLFSLRIFSWYLKVKEDEFEGEERGVKGGRMRRRGEKEEEGEEDEEEEEGRGAGEGRRQ